MPTRSRFSSGHPARFDAGPDSEVAAADIPVPDLLVTENRVTGCLYGPDGAVLALHLERDQRFGFARWRDEGHPAVVAGRK